MNQRSPAAYSLHQRLLEGSAIVLFVLLAGLSFWRLYGVTGSTLVLIMLIALPCGWLVADFLSGLVHFALDTLGSVQTPLIGKGFIRPFREHHVNPQAMTGHDFVETHGASCLACLPALTATSLMPLGSTPWVMTQAILFCAALGGLFTNQCHKWAHMAPLNTPRLARWAQRSHLILSPEHHQRHHTAPFNSYFCMANGWLNPVFNAVLRRCR